MFEGQNAVLFDIFWGDDTIESEPGSGGLREKESGPAAASLADLKRPNPGWLGRD